MNDNRAPTAGPASGNAQAGDDTLHLMNRRSLLRWGIGAAAVAATGPALAACGSSDASSNGKVTLKVVGFEVTPDEKGSALDKAYKAFLADFRAKHPKIEIQSLQTPPNFDTQIIVDLASGSAPDLWSQDASSLAPLVERNLLLDMRKCLKQAPSLDVNGFFPQVLDIHKAKDGALYGLPNDFTPMVTYFNPTLFTKAGIPAPQQGWTWDDQLAAAQRLTLDKAGRNRLDPAFDDKNVVQWGYRLSKYTYQWVYRIWQNGGDVISPDHTTASGYLDSPQSLEAIQWYADLVLKHKVSPKPSDLDNMTHASSFENLYVKGTFAMFDSGHWELVGLTDADGFKDNMLGVAPQPKRVTEATAIYESSFVAPHDLTPEKINAVAQFVAAATGRAYQDTKCITGIALSASQQAAQASLGNSQSQFRNLDKVFIDATAHGRAPYGSKIGKYPTIETELDGMMEKILNGSPVADEVARTITTVNRELKSR